MSGHSDATILKVDNVYTNFGSQVVHSGVSFSISDPGYIALIGGSGSGKTVLLKEIIGLIKPASNKISIFNMSPQEAFAAEGIRKNPVGVLFQQGALFSSLTVAENVESPLREHTHLNQRERKKIARLKMSLAGFPLSSSNKMASELSGGMLKRAALARALALEPKLLLCDEPTSGLDPINARSFDELMVTLAQALKITALVVTHDLASVLSYAGRVIALADGKVLADGAAPELKKVDHPWLKEYLGAGE